MVSVDMLVLGEQRCWRHDVQLREAHLGSDVTLPAVWTASSRFFGAGVGFGGGFDFQLYCRTADVRRQSDGARCLVDCPLRGASRSEIRAAGHRKMQIVGRVPDQQVDQLQGATGQPVDLVENQQARSVVRLTWLDQCAGEGRRCSMTSIEIRGARTHNLKGIDVDVPKHRLVAFTGVSGSGKSSLVFDTICTEAQRQLVETFSTYARRRLPQLTRPPVDAIRNISPCIVIDQKRLGRSSRSTVGTVTEIYTYLRMLFSRCGRPFAGWSHRFSFNHPDGMCPACKGLGKRITVDVDKLLDLDRSIEEGAIRHPAYDIGNVVLAGDRPDRGRPAPQAAAPVHGGRAGAPAVVG